MRNLIRDYKQANPDASTRGLSREIDIPSSSLSKIENLQKDPTLEEMLRILSGTGNLHRAGEVLKDVCPELLWLLDKNTTFGSKEAFYPPELDPYFAEEVSCIIILAAACESGTSKSEIKKLYGEVGTKTLDKLLSDNILAETEGKITMKKILFRQFKPRELRNVLKNCLNSFYDESNFGTGNNWISFYAQSVDKEKVVPKVRSIMEKAFNDITRILKDEENYGNDKLFTGMVMDLFGVGVRKNEEEAI
jgi:hypothetical protein